MSSSPHTYRDVDLPDEWAQWPTDAKVNYLANSMGRDQLLALVGERAGLPDEEIGAQSIHKNGLAQLIVRLEECSAN